MDPPRTTLERWPGVTGAEEEFEGWARARGAHALPPERQAELHLSFACARGDPQALRAFDDGFLQHLAPAVARFGDAAFVADVCQVVRRRLLVAEGGEPKIAEYRGRGELAKFVRAVAVRTALNLLDHEGPHAKALSDEAFLDTPAQSDDPELAAMKVRYRGEFKQAFAAALGSLEEPLRSALRLYYLDGLSLADLARLHGWSVPTASRRLASARAALLEATRQAMSARLGLSASELDSVLRLIRSRLSLDGLEGP